MRLFANANYDFLGRRKVAFGLTALFLAIGLMASIVWGFDYSLEFTGGTMVQIETRDEVDVGDLRTALQDQGITGAEIQTFGSDREYVIRAGAAAEGADVNDTQATADAITAALDAALGQGNYEIHESEATTPRVSGELRTDAAIAVLLSFVVVLIYLAFRFEWRFGLAAVAATAHDVLGALAFIAIMRIEISLFVVAALLSIVGYSLNDTIVIFDRVRENLHRARTESFSALLNRSVNETLPRTVLTGGTAIGSLTAMAALGGDVVRPFALIMLFGVVVGTFSSIFIASPVLLMIEERWPGPHARGLKKGAAREKAPGRRAQPVA